MSRRSCLWPLVLLALALGGCFTTPDVHIPPPSPSGSDPGTVTATKKDHWPSYGTTLPGSPCSTPPVIDGNFGHFEWSCAGSAVGLYGHMYAIYMGGTLYIANDWRLRTDTPICPGMFNQFWLNMPQGTFDVRVFEKSIEVRRDGVLLAGGQGAAGFGPTPDMEKPHAVFEFALPIGSLPPQTSIVMTGSDPCNNFLQYASSSGQACPPSAAAMIDEPMCFHMTVEQAYAGLKVEPGDEAKLPLTGVEPWPLKRGQQATIRGAGLAAGQGASVRLGGLVADNPAWLGNCVIFHVPAGPAGKVDLVVERAGHTSQTLSVDVE